MSMSRREVMNPGSSMPAVAWSLASVEQTDLGELSWNLRNVHTLVGRYLGRCGIRTCYESEWIPTFQGFKAYDIKIWYNHIMKSYPHVSISSQNAESERRSEANRQNAAGDAFLEQNPAVPGECPRGVIWSPTHRRFFSSLLDNGCLKSWNDFDTLGQKLHIDSSPHHLHSAFRISYPFEIGLLFVAAQQSECGLQIYNQLPDRIGYRMIHPGSFRILHR